MISLGHVLGVCGCACGVGCVCARGVGCVCGVYVLEVCVGCMR